MNVGDVIRITSMTNISVRHPLYAKSIPREDGYNLDNDAYEILSGGYSMGGEWVTKGFTFYLPRSRKYAKIVSWVEVTNDDKLWAEFVAHQLTEGDQQ